MNDLSGEYEVNIDSVPELEDAVITVFTEEDGQITLAVFDTAQWEIVNDLVKLTQQSQEDVVRSLAKEIPSVFTFDPNDFDF
jgi:hypothetical protein